MQFLLVPITDPLQIVPPRHKRRGGRLVHARPSATHRAPAFRRPPATRGQRLHHEGVLFKMPMTKKSARPSIIVRKQRTTTTSRGKDNNRRERLQALLVELMGLAVTISQQPATRERKILERWIAKRL